MRWFPHGLLGVCVIAGLAYAEPDVAPFRTEAGRLGFLVRGAQTPSGIRILIDEHEQAGG
ncbi:MAG TPA: hypothetical protein GX399_08340, partial [Xanthomonadaceae bacterium]|nr:hypothetical protein [Xanthomonadaceae bacterium]